MNKIKWEDPKLIQFAIPSAYGACKPGSGAIETVVMARQEAKKIAKENPACINGLNPETRVVVRDEDK